MKCPHCKYKKTNVVKTVGYKNTKYRWRVCERCEESHYTEEKQSRECPSCAGSDSTSVRTRIYHSVMERDRECKNKKCRHKWKTVETLSSRDKFQLALKNKDVNQMTIGE